MIVLTLVLLLSAETIGLNYTECGDDYFFNHTIRQCQVCSKCKPFMIQKLCSGDKDTSCGGRNEIFNFFNGAQETMEIQTNATPQLILSNEDKVYWKKLAFSLIGLLSVLVTVTTLTVLITYYKFKHTGWFCKRVNQDQDDMENGYVVIHKFIPDPVSLCHNHQSACTASEASSSNPVVSGAGETTHPLLSYKDNPRRCKPYRPKRRLMNECVDEVFESDDSGGSRSLRLPLATIPEGDGSSSDIKASPGASQA